jgi:hypothetical protein
MFGLCGSGARQRFNSTEERVNPARRGGHRTKDFWFGIGNLVTLSRGIGPRCAHGGTFSLGARFEICPGAKLLKNRVESGGVLMLSPDESDAMKKAWTYAVLDAVKAADENTRLEIARILCPAGFEIVKTAARKH